MNITKHIHWTWRHVITARVTYSIYGLKNNMPITSEFISLLMYELMSWLSWTLPLPNKLLWSDTSLCMILLEMTFVSLLKSEIRKYISQFFITIGSLFLIAVNVLQLKDGRINKQNGQIGLLSSYMVHLISKKSAWSEKTGNFVSYYFSWNTWIWKIKFNFTPYSHMLFEKLFDYVRKVSCRNPGHLGPHAIGVYQRRWFRCKSDG